LDEIKTHLGGSHLILRSQHPDGAEQELYGFLLVHHAIRTLMHRAAREGDHDPDRISFTRSLRVVRRQVTDQAAFPPSRLARAVKATLAELLQRLLPARRRRTNPRVIKRKVAGWPLKRAQHYVPHHPPEPTITIIAATKTKRVKRAKAP
jgi:hypothetical protein